MEEIIEEIKSTGRFGICEPFPTKRTDRDDSLTDDGRDAEIRTGKLREIYSEENASVRFRAPAGVIVPHAAPGDARICSIHRYRVSARDARHGKIRQPGEEARRGRQDSRERTPGMADAADRTGRKEGEKRWRRETRAKETARCRRR